MKVVLFIVGGIFIAFAVIKLLSEWELKWKTFGLGLGIVGGSLANWAGNSTWQVILGAGFLLIGVVCFIIGIITGIIDFFRSGSSGSSSSSGPDITQMLRDRMERRKGGERTCFTCDEYSKTGKKCKLSNDPKSAEDSCSNWS